MNLNRDLTLKGIDSRRTFQGFSDYYVFYQGCRFAPTLML
jgi:hypothetical protein